MYLKRNLTHPYILTAFGAVAIIAFGSIVYYAIESRVPDALVSVETHASSTVITSGTVEPAQNPDLAFQSGGRVARLFVAVGDHVVRGQLLASLDTASLSAQRSQAEANRAAQQAKLDEMLAGPRSVDVTIKETVVAQAKLALSNEYQTALNAVSDAYGKSISAMHTNTDTLFNNPNSLNPSAIFTSANTTDLSALSNTRISVNGMFTSWQQEVTSLSPATSENDVEAALTHALSNLMTLRTYSNVTVQALGGAIPSGIFSQANISSDLTTASTMRDAISTLISSLQSIQQTLATQKLAVQSAQNSLDQILAGSTKESIDAQRAQVQAADASVQNLNAQISNAQVVAPFSGTVASVHVKLGDIVPQGTVALSLDPINALQITSYVSESDVVHITIGQIVDITLDAYGTDRNFTATVATIDRSPTMRQNIPAYKITLQFASSDPAISSGMTANITFNK